MSSKRCPEEVKIEAVKKVSEQGHPLAEVAGRSGASALGSSEWPILLVNATSF